MSKTDKRENIIMVPILYHMLVKHQYLLLNMCRLRASRSLSRKVRCLGHIVC